MKSTVIFSSIVTKHQLQASVYRMIYSLYSEIVDVYSQHKIYILWFYMYTYTNSIELGIFSVKYIK